MAKAKCSDCADRTAAAVLGSVEAEHEIQQIEAGKKSCPGCQPRRLCPYCAQPINSATCQRSHP